ncbi:hypothetical protein KOI35_38810 [Actinoplanes bogorensis]|uniref:Uncharacterized protein n=1 Tax=Paractinoplanes bogorensis TaxID=1610840 RepID=A0ABS5Z1B0_9ACTN|nr:hypothetical protein [Actinoplanes bogorensis]MBU2669479.1 hypothetical protein [Actinoplanes bogorensis]
MTGGYVLGEQQRNDDRSSGGGVAGPSDPTDSPSPAFTPPGPFCLDEARQTAESEGFTSELWQVLKVRIDRTNTMVWVCMDRNGGYFYQSWSNVDRPLVQNKTGLFLPGVVEADGTYRATAPDGNVFTVSKTKLTVTFASGKAPQTDKARPVD